jgi:hypothetical protein
LAVQTAVNKQIQTFKDQAKALNQRINLSIYTFSDRVHEEIFNESLEDVGTFSYSPYGNTAIRDAYKEAINELKTVKVTKNTDLSRLIIAFTDGEDNNSSFSSGDLKKMISSLDETWTIGANVPTLNAKSNVVSCGIPQGNIQIWDLSEQGTVKMSETNVSATTSYLVSRSAGAKGTKSLYQIDTSKLDNKKNITKALDEINPIDYMLLPVHKESVIKDYVESWTKEPYRVGSTYYQLVKAEKVQPYKGVILQDKLTGKLYGGDVSRKLLALPSHEVKIEAASHPKYDIFINSTSTNRKLAGGTKIVVLK